MNSWRCKAKARWMCEKTMETRNIFVNRQKKSRFSSFFFFPQLTEQNVRDPSCAAVSPLRHNRFLNKKKTAKNTNNPFLLKRTEEKHNSVWRFCSQHLHRRRASSYLEELTATSSTNTAVRRPEETSPLPSFHSVWVLLCLLHWFQSASLCE